ncbi:hypothetical protein BG005_009053, partial [Podila minutissima]
MAEHDHRETEALLEAERGGPRRLVRVTQSQSHYEPQSKWAGIRRKFRKAFAEFLGTAILVAFGSGAIAQLVFSHNNSWFTMSLGWGLGLTFGIYVSGGVS